VFALHAVREAEKSGKGLAFSSIGFRHREPDGSPVWDMDVPEEENCFFWRRETKRLHALPVSAFLELQSRKPLEDYLEPWSLATEVIVRSEYTPQIIQAFDSGVRIPACFVQMLRDSPNSVVEFSSLSPQNQSLLQMMQRLFNQRPGLIEKWEFAPLDEWLDYPESWEQRMVVGYVFRWLSRLSNNVDENIVNRLLTSSKLKTSLQQEND